MRLMVDLDGCVTQYTPGYAECVEEQRGLPRRSIDPNVKTWSFYKLPPWNMTSPEWIESMREAILKQNLFGRLKAWPGAILSIRHLHGEGHELVAVTNRVYGEDTREAATEQTMTWLAKAGILHRFKEVVVIDGSIPKSTVCASRGLTVAIEDHVANQDELLRGGIRCFLMSRAWNEGHITPLRVASWSDFNRRVRDLEEADK